MEVALRAVYHRMPPGVQDAFEINDGHGGSVFVDSHRAVQVKALPVPLPAVAGVHILAHVRDGEDIPADRHPMLLEYFAEQWRVPGVMEVVNETDILPGWVRVDPQTLRPVEEG